MEDRYLPPDDVLTAASEAVKGWHYRERHTSFRDSLALTHCICFGSVYRTLVWLHEHPEALAALAADPDA